MSTLDAFSPTILASEDEFRLWGPIKPSVLPLWKRFYSHESPTKFLQILKFHLKPEHDVLEVGAGTGLFFPCRIRGTVRRFVGIDPDPRVLDNQQLDESIIGTCEKMSFPEKSFDVVFHRMLAEHLPDPTAATVEIARVLKSGGILIMHTPNKLHYSMIISRLTPMWFHRMFMRLLATRPNPKDVHFAYYRMNSTRDIRRICQQAGLEVLQLDFLTAPPGYLRFSRLAFLIGTLHAQIVERLVPRLRPFIVLIARKPITNGGAQPSS